MKRLEHQEFREGGFTLVELLVSLTLAMLVAGAIAAFNRFQLFSLQNQAVQLDVQGTARAVTDLVAREVRRAGLNAKPPVCGLTHARWNSIRIKADYNNDGSVSGPNEDITYHYDVFRRVIERTDHNANRTDVLVEGFETMLFALQYFDGNGTELIGSLGISGLDPAQRTAVRRVRVSLVLREDAADPTNAQRFEATLATDIDLRNRFFAGTGVNAQVCS